MFRCRGRIFRLAMALVLCLQSSLAMAHCLRLGAPAAGPAPLQVEICTLDGLVTIDLADEGSPPEQDAQPRGRVCLACHALSCSLLPEPPLLAERLARPIAAALAVHPAPARPGARAPPYASRAPPGLS